MFDSIKKSLGLSKSRQESKGQRLGTAAEDAEAKAARIQSQSQVSSSGAQTPVPSRATDYEIVDRLFREQKLGITIIESRNRLPIDAMDTADNVSRACVNEVSSSGEAARLGTFQAICRAQLALNSLKFPLGIRKGDYIIALNDAVLQQFDDFHAIVGALERPVKISFLRLVAPGSPPSLLPTGSISSIFKFGGKSGQSQPSPNDAELDARREERLKAVNDRTLALDKKFKKSSGSGKSPTNGGSATPSSSSNSIENVQYAESDNAETRRVIERTKAEEHRVEQNLGYNPFRPHMSFSGNAATVATLGMTAPPSSNGRPTVTTSAPSSSATVATPAESAAAPYLEEDEDIIAEVDDSFAMLLSLTDAEQDRAKVAVQTVQKMVVNLYNSKNDVKFRSIRMSNKAFQARVGSVPGGVELLLAAGYRLEMGDSLESQGSSARAGAEEALPVSVSRSDDALNESEARETYLLHHMDPMGERKLNYTVSRLQELLEMQSKV